MAVVVRPYEHGAELALIREALHVEEGDEDDMEAQAKEDEDEPQSGPYVVVGDEIRVDEQEGFLRGHGTHVLDGKLRATMCGVLERVNKLVYVRPLNSRYSAEQGDVVVGRITEVVGKRWKVDLNSRQEAALQLSAVNLPGGIQRRRNAEDELNMRTFFKEGDLISAEVQALHSDGSIALHTRSLKYGKLAGGQVVVVSPNLIKRQKQHFHTLEALGVDLILGLNGQVWVTAHVPRAEDGSSSGSEAPATCPALTPQQRQAVTRVAQAIRALARLYMPVYAGTILEVVGLAVDSGVPLAAMTERDFLAQVVQAEAQRRQQEGARG